MNTEVIKDVLSYIHGTLSQLIKMDRNAKKNRKLLGAYYQEEGSGIMKMRMRRSTMKE